MTGDHLRPARGMANGIALSGVIWTLIGLAAAFSVAAQTVPKAASTLHLGTPCGTAAGLQPCRAAPMVYPHLKFDTTIMPSMTTSFSSSSWPEPSLTIKGTGEIELFDCRRHVMIHVADVKVIKRAAWMQTYRGFKFRAGTTREQMERVAMIFLGTLEKDYTAGKCSP